jgi:hypothetical protein
MSIPCSHLPTPRGCSFVVSFVLSMLTAVTAPAHAQKTISYYTDNVIERIDKVLACRDGAEDPMSLGCRNASTAHQMDIQLAGRSQRSVSLAMSSVQNSPNKRESRALLVIDNNFKNSTASICINLTDGAVLTNPTSKASLKLALDEKLLEPKPSQPGRYRATARGEAFLLAQQKTSKSGFFCPVTVQYDPEIKVVEFKDLTAQNKGKKSESGQVLKAVAIATVEIPLMNTSASVWFAKKLYPKALPKTGLAVGRYYIMEYANEKGTAGFGRILSIDGVTVSEAKEDEIFEKMFK